MSTSTGDDGDGHGVPPALFTDSYIKQENNETDIVLSYYHTPDDSLNYTWVEVKEESTSTDVKTSLLADSECIPEKQSSPFPLTISSDFKTDVKEESNEVVIEHTQIQPQDISYKMPLPVDTSKKSDLRHRNMKNFECSVCVFSTARHKVFNEHMLGHHGETPEWSQCNYRTTQNLHHCRFESLSGRDGLVKCDFKTENIQKLKEHVKIHKKIMAEKGQVTRSCTFCDFTTPAVTFLHKHFLWAHTITHKNAYECTLCKFKIRSRHLLLNHLKKHPIQKDCDTRCHENDKYYICISCEFKTTEESELITHLQEHVPKIRYQCTSCPYTTQSSELMTKHMQCHKSEKKKASHNKKQKLSISQTDKTYCESLNRNEAKLGGGSSQTDGRRASKSHRQEAK